MLSAALKKIFGSKHERDAKKLVPIAEEINAAFELLHDLSDDELRQKTQAFRGRIKEETAEIEKEIAELKEKLKIDIEGEERKGIYERLDNLEQERDDVINDILDEILPEAFAVVKEACRRLVGQSWEVTGHKIVWDMVPFDVQLMGAAVLHRGEIAEMATGEGKTLVAVMPMYLSALPGRGTHLVTVNDYLAKRDSEWMGKVFEFLGLTVGCIQSDMDTSQRRKMYECDITYGTNNEFGFDYLRDNMGVESEDIVQREHYYAIVDEVDSVLIDEARTPLIISGPVGSTEHTFDDMKPRVERLVNEQIRLINKYAADAEKLLSEGKDKEAGVLLLRSYRGFPKNKKITKLLNEPSNKRLMQETELEYLKDQGSRMHEIDDELYYAVDEKTHVIDLTEKGREYLASSQSDKDMFILPDIGTEVSVIEGDKFLTPAQVQRKKEELYKLYAERSDRIHTVSQLLRAYSLYEKDVEYVVQDDKVLIVDEFTGRILQGRRYSEGLHQAIEAKEGVKVERDTQTLATITLQNYFRLYKKLAGMTGTAETEAGEFFDIYKLDVVVVPTNKPVTRDDQDDLIYRTRREKYNAVIGEIEDMRKQSRPVLVGTTSVDVSETLSRMLKRRGVSHEVLNAKQHQREAEIITRAGMPGAITIATNMAGRGTDIKLGPGVVEKGGLHIIGTERHEARRIDRQLRGRAGRQGDPGSSVFYLSLEDDLLRLFGSDRIARVMDRFGMKEGDVIQHSMITRSVERAQRKVEENNFAIRKRLLEYDNVMNQQREVVYDRRRHALVGERLKDEIFDMMREHLGEIVNKYYDDGDIAGLVDELRRTFLVDVNFTPDEFRRFGKDGVSDRAYNAAVEFYNRKEQELGVEIMSRLERMATLQVIDEKWKEHLREMDDLKEGINLRAYGQKDPLVEYKREAFEMFVEMLKNINREVLQIVFRAFPAQAEEIPQRRAAKMPRREQMQLHHDSAVGLGMQANREPAAQGAEGQIKRKPIRVAEKVGRNDPCPCGSGKKYKNCHGK
ncbi:MAG: preprotein translocase subunit SecA [Bacteroidetes bacterium]|nr:preprotein translocase subunit SecA [Bacteroidota bacterium]MCL5739129.1 preprotein translocase subunit SecA [Bacteroidota bacterium]